MIWKEGVALEKMEKFKEALTIYDRQEKKAKEIGYKYGQACALENKATVLVYDLEEKAEASSLLSRSMTIAVENGYHDIVNRLWDLNEVIK